MRETRRGVGEYLLTGKAPQLSICPDRLTTDDRYVRAIAAVAEALLDWEMLDWDEVEEIVDSALASL